MRRSTVLAFVALLHAAPCLAAEGPAPVLGPDGKPLEVTAQVPNGAGVGLSLAMPGWSQLYLGDKARGYTYLGGALVVGLGLAGVEHLYITATTGYSPNPEAIAFEIVQGLVIGWFATGAVSAWDAAHAISERQPALSPPAGGQP